MTATMGRPATAAPTREARVLRAARPTWRRRIPTILAAALWAVAVACAVWAVVGAFPDVVRPPRAMPTPANLAFAAFAGVLGMAVAHRRRIAFWVLTGYLLIAIVVAIGSGHDVVRAVGTPLAALGLLLTLVAYGEFTTRARWAGLPWAVGLFVVLAAAGIWGGRWLVTEYPGTVGQYRLGYAAEMVLGGLIVDPDREGRAPGWVDLLLGLAGAVALLAAVAVVLLRSRRRATPRDAGAEQGVRDLLARYGDRDPLGYFATRRDLAVAFSPTGKAAVPYRVVRGVSLAAGDPIGDPEAWGPAIDAWMARAEKHGWKPAVHAASEEGASAYARAGLAGAHRGDAATLLSGEFTVEGRDMRPVRQAAGRAEAAGYTALVRRSADASPEELATARALANGWPAAFGPALGRLGDPADGRCVLVEAFDADGARKALLALAPWGERGLVLDLLRRAPDAVDGVVEFLMVALMRDAARLGVDRVCLGVADSPERYRFQARYQPLWHPRYLCANHDVTRALVSAGRVTRLAAPAVAQATAAAEPATDTPMPEQAQVRLAKRERLVAAGIDPYPVGFHRTDNSVALAIRYEGLPPDSATGDRVAVAGRVVLLRDHGGVCFATIRDWTGDLQVLVDSGLSDWRSTVDLGDHLGVRGEVVTSKRGELSVRAESWELTAKCLRPLPDKRRGLADPEARVRLRYLDLITSAETRDLLRARSAATHSLRETLIDRGYLEVETPVLQRVHGGACARPLATHLHAYDARLYLRVAHELHLKRLAVGGVERVFEMGRVFRNESVDHTHSPEFTLLEAYQAYADYRTMRELAQALVQRAALAVYGSTVAHQPGPYGVPVEHDLSGEWPVVTVNEALSTALGEWVTADTGLSALRRMSDAAGVPYDPRWERGALLQEMYERLVLPRTTTPAFYTDFPLESAPLARAHRKDPRLAERWDLVAFGVELGTAYSELTDPVEQRRRMTEQSLLAAGGDPEAMELDEDFLQALEYAMPPTGGLGIGVDRLVMLLTGRAIRDTLPFPLVR
ncbi:bifunctional lysylphosphatidylglycerol synthetase/lysine--tRNA ligase LysX [Phytohabitans aurantiacus]|uniref:Lysine--tRNA ligase n=1 Tax=Phytohabitans aurantiacus TaxID=3016789 RepID=A0ABQ5QRJ2_9ACTN|nr:bifunctional lysylphosphatidylglycerol synthetase/lysine--tRNA ligase LysX [Phytohabitans aurantiacus]GLH97240.1 lysine--tRNA ligase [Phytohabitans aurantiacus]